MTHLALAQINGPSRWRRSAARRRLQQLEHAGIVLSDDIHLAGRLRGREAKQRAAVAARQMDGVDEADRSEQAQVARSRQSLPERVARLVRDNWIRIDVVRRKRLPREGWRLRGVRLRGPRLFTRHFAPGYRTLLDRPDRRAGDPIEHVQETRFTGHGDDVDVFTAALDARQLRCGVVF